MAGKSKGRQKIQMTRMSKESNLLVTFSKRRSGLFKKASELCTLCGAEIAIIVFSPGKKVFSFGHPSVTSIANRFLSPPPPPNNQTATAAAQILEAHRGAAVRELNGQLTEAGDRLEAEKKRGEEIERVRRERKEERCWWEGPIGVLGLGQLEQLKVAMEDLKRNVVKQADKGNNGLGFWAGPNSVGGLRGGGGPDVDVKVNGLGLSVTQLGYTLGYGRGFF